MNIRFYHLFIIFLSCYSTSSYGINRNIQIKNNENQEYEPDHNDTASPESFKGINPLSPIYKDLLSPKLSYKSEPTDADLEAEANMKKMRKLRRAPTLVKQENTVTYQWISYGILFALMFFQFVTGVVVYVKLYGIWVKYRTAKDFVKKYYTLIDPDTCTDVECKVHVLRKGRLQRQHDRAFWLVYNLIEWKELEEKSKFLF